MVCVSVCLCACVRVCARVSVYVSARECVSVSFNLHLSVFCSIVIAVDQNAYQIYINRELFAVFAHRLPFSLVDEVRVTGNVSVQSLLKRQPATTACDGLCVCCRERSIMGPVFSYMSSSSLSIYASL